MEDAGVLAGTNVCGVVDMARNEVVARLQFRRPDPSFHRFSRWRRDLELDRSPRLALQHARSRRDAVAVTDVANL